MIERKSPTQQTSGEPEPTHDNTTGAPAQTTPFDGTIQSGRDVDALALHDPAEYDRLLRGYFRLLGDRRAWWQTDAADSRWKCCVQAAIRAVAERSRIKPQALASYLRDSDCPGARRVVLELAHEMRVGEAAA